jgi:hypothetical protein
VSKNQLITAIAIVLVISWAAHGLAGFLIVGGVIFACYVVQLRRRPRSACTNSRCDGGRLRGWLLFWTYRHHRKCGGSGRQMRFGARFFASPRHRILARRKPASRRQFVH